MTCEEKLAEAKTALHALALGQQVVQLAFEGESTVFTPADLGRLRGYIAELEAECGGDAGEPKPRAPLRVYL